MIATEILKIDPQRPDSRSIARAARVIRRGGLVAFPTETVYGLGADALSIKAVKSLFKAKGRPADNPLIVHISSMDDLDRLVVQIPDKARLLMDRFWPGPLTLILKKSEAVPNVTTAGLDTVGIRMPNHPIAKLLIQYANTPVAAPSANISGSPSPTKFEHVFKDLYGKIHMIIDGGSTYYGVESTVVDVTVDPPAVLRPGAIPLEAIRRVVGKVSVNRFGREGELRSHQTPKSPGLKYKHYAPKTKLIVVEGALDKVQSRITELIRVFTKSGLRVGVLAMRGAYAHGIVRRVGNGTFPSIARDLYSGLRDLDNMGLDVIIAEGIRARGLGWTIMDRLRRASGGNIIKVS